MARLHAGSVAGGSGRDAEHVVLYEDGARRKVVALLSAIKDLQAVTRWGEREGEEGCPPDACTHPHSHPLAHALSLSLSLSLSVTRSLPLSRSHTHIHMCILGVLPVCVQGGA